MHRYICCISLSFLFLACESPTVKKEYYKSGEVKAEYQVENGEISGLYKRYYKSGTLKSEIPYTEGKINGLKKIFKKNGDISWEAEYTDGKLNGICREYSPEGSVITKGYFKNGKQEGKTTKMYDDGTVKIENNYENGLAQGKFKEYYKNGQILMDALYNSDSVVYYSKFSEQGNIIDFYRCIDIQLPKEPVRVGKEYMVNIHFYGPLNKEVKYKFYFEDNDKRLMTDSQVVKQKSIIEKFKPQKTGILKIGVLIEEPFETYKEERTIKVVKS